MKSIDHMPAHWLLSANQHLSALESYFVNSLMSFVIYYEVKRKTEIQEY